MGPDQPLYGLDIETDTTIDGLDPATSPIVAVAVSSAEHDVVLTGPEATILGNLDALLLETAPGIIVTWNGAAFDLPFLADRGDHLGVPLGLRLRLDPVLRARTPLPGHEGAYRAGWHGHRHLDAYRVYRNDLHRHLELSCSLKSVASFLGIPAVQVDASRIHELGPEELAAYVASDARVACAVARRRWATATPFLDPVVEPGEVRPLASPAHR